MDAPSGYRITRTLISTAPQRAGGVTALVSILLLALSQFIFQENLFGWGDLMPASPDRVFGHHELWRAWTTIGVHGDMEHFLNNFGFFAGLAFLLRGYFGWMAFPFLSLFFGGIINLISLATYPVDATLVGASGVVYFMAAFWMALYVGIDRSATLERRLGNALGFFFVLLMPQTFEPKVSYRTHFIGLGFGLLVGALFFLARKSAIREWERLEPIEPDPVFEDEIQRLG